MTREKAKKRIETSLITLYDIDENVIECNDAMGIIGEISNDHEAQLKAKDEKIKQLNNAYAEVAWDFEGAVMEIEALQQPKSCEGCEEIEVSYEND